MTDTKQLVALVTGANRGIGLETSRQLADQGITVLMAGRNLDATTAASAPLREQGLAVEPVELDVGNADHIEAVRALIESRYGKLDILVNNAGVMADTTGFMVNNSATVTPAELHQNFDVNLFSIISLTQALLPLVRKAEAGRIVNVSSILGSLTVHSAPGDTAGYKPTAYSMSKAALNMWTVCLAQSLHDTPIKVNSAHPGWVKTELGTEYAPMEVTDGAKTSVALALLGADGPSGRFIHAGEELPW